jgi:hypothetical protein
MKCPYCGLEIEEKKDAKLYFCHHCQSILDENLKKKLHVEKDKNGKEVEEYIPNEQARFEYGDKYYVANYSYKEKFMTVAEILFVLFSIFAFIGIGILFLYMKQTNLGIFWFVSSFVFLIVSGIRLLLRKGKRHSGHIYLPVSFYGNQDVFGYLALQNQDYADTVEPDIHRVEVKKKDIVGVEYSELTDCCFVMLAEDVDVGNGEMQNFIEIPYILDTNRIDDYFGPQKLSE